MRTSNLFWIMKVLHDFSTVNTLTRNRRRNEAARTLLLHRYISGDAIMFCLASAKFKPPQGTYVYDVLLSVATEPQLWTPLWRPPRTTGEKKVTRIVLPINVQNIHWYLAILQVDEEGVELEIQNNLQMRDTKAEQKLVNIGKKYQAKMNDIVRKRQGQESLITPQKERSRSDGFTHSPHQQISQRDIHGNVGHLNRSRRPTQFSPV